MSGSTTEDRDRLSDAARRVFEPRAGRRLRDEDLREIGENLVGFFRILGQWSQAEQRQIPPPSEGDSGIESFEKGRSSVSIADNDLL